MTKPRMPGEDQLIRGQLELAAGLKDIYQVMNNYLTTRVVDIVPGSTLWHIAETELGDGQRWREIAIMNMDRLLTEQDVHNAPLGRQDFIYAGDKVRILAF